MSLIRIGLLNDRTQFEPGETISGAVLWELDEAPKAVELRLVWSTRGKGSQDVTTVACESFPTPLAGDTRPFTMTLPDSPYSFSGTLVSLVWALELVIGKLRRRLEITIAPGGREIILPPGKKRRHGLVPF